MDADGTPAVFLDRDGTIIVEKHYLADPESVELIPGAVEALHRFRTAGYALVLVTNQSGIARGLFTEQAYRGVQSRLEKLLADGGIVLDASYHCPHHPDHGGACACRKPGAALFEQAIREHRLDPRGSVFIGDRLSDVLPAFVLGGRAVLVRTGHGARAEAEAADTVTVVDDLEAAARVVLEGRLEGPKG